MLFIKGQLRGGRIMPLGISELEMDVGSRATNSITRWVQLGRFRTGGEVLGLAGDCGKSARVGSGRGRSLGRRAAR